MTDPCNSLDILFLGRVNCLYSQRLMSTLKSRGANVEYIESKSRTESLPKKISGWKGHLIVSFRSYFILKRDLICKAKWGALNFHPGPPKYRGSCPASWALYNGDNTFGVTAHIMDEKLDHGQIIETKSFPIDASDTIDSLLKKTHSELFNLANTILIEVLSAGPTFIQTKLNEKDSSSSWSGPVYSFREADSISKVDPQNTSKDELRRLIRAFNSSDYPVWIELHGYRFLLSCKE